MTSSRVSVDRISMVRGALLVSCAVIMTACASFEGSSSDTLAPLTSDPTVTSTSPSVDDTVAISSTTTSSTSPITTTVPPTEPAVTTGPFPTTVPAGKCTPQAIGADFGTNPESWLECSGAWAVTRVEECPPDTECEGVDIFRWTNDGWVHRGMTYSLCVLMVDETGLPRSINAQILTGNTDCIETIRYTNEGSTAPLQVGSKGERTRRMQQRLIEWRLLNDKADGYFGANTRNAVFDFQHLAGLEPTGDADERTLRALGLPWP